MLGTDDQNRRGLMTWKENPTDKTPDSRFSAVDLTRKLARSVVNCEYEMIGMVRPSNDGVHTSQKSKLG